MRCLFDGSALPGHHDQYMRAIPLDLRRQNDLAALTDPPQGRMAGSAPDSIAAADANAVYDAIGVRVLVIPLTPERVWRALQDLDSSP